MTPEVAMKNHLESAGLGLALGTNLFYGPERPSLIGTGSTSAVAPDVPEECVFLLPRGGPPPEPYLNGGETSIYTARVTVIIRSSLQTFIAGLTLARSILTSLHCAELSGFISCFAQSSDPEYVGPNDVGQLRWTVDFEIACEQA